MFGLGQHEHHLLGTKTHWTGRVEHCTFQGYRQRYPRLAPSHLLSLVRRAVPPGKSLLHSTACRGDGTGGEPAEGASQFSLALTRRVVGDARSGSWPSALAAVLRPGSCPSLLPRDPFTLPLVALKHLRPVAEMSGHKWLASYCLSYDGSGRALVSGADDGCVA